MRLTITSRDGAEQSRRRAEAFFFAATRDWFDGTITSVTEDPTVPLQWRAVCDHLAFDAIGTLHGMLTHLVEIDEVAQAFALVQEPGGADLLRASYPPAQPVAPDFPVTVQLADAVAPPMALVIAFVKPIPAASRPELQRDLEAWVELLRGGYALEDDPFGTSGIAATELTFANPRMATFVTDGCRFGEAGLAPLYRLLRSWHARFGIQHLSVE